MWTTFCLGYVESVMHWFPRPPLFIVILLSCACAEREEVVRTIYTEPPECVGSGRVVSDGFKTPWGFTLRDVQNTVIGSHQSPLTWRHEKEISYGVEGTSTTLLVEITRRGAATFFERNGAHRASDMAHNCRSNLLMPVHVKAMTEDGVFSMEGDSELRVFSQDFIGVTLDAVGRWTLLQRGTLQIRGTRDKGTVVTDLGIFLGFRVARTMVGAIGGYYRCADELTCLHVPYAYACFPESPPFQLHERIFHGCSG